MLISRLKITGLLSFGPAGIDLPLRPLNVFIGANGSGKSNLLDVLSLLRAAPTDLARPIREGGGIEDWMWKGPGAENMATVEALFDPTPTKSGGTRHVFSFREHAHRLKMTEERIDEQEPHPGQPAPFYWYRLDSESPVIFDMKEFDRVLPHDQINPGQSILGQIKDPERYPVLTQLQNAYPTFALFRSWTFGPGSPLRQPQSPEGRTDFLDDNCVNLPLVLHELLNDSAVRPVLVERMQLVYEGLEDVKVVNVGGRFMCCVEEAGGRRVMSSRLSDGTLRFLCLLTILLHPKPPPLVAIDEPELGLHPDIIGELAPLLVEASERTQLMVTTHSRILIDALSDHADSVVVCSREDTGSSFKRLDADHLAEWLEEYSLGEMWSRGHLGGNRW